MKSNYIPIRIHYTETKSDKFFFGLMFVLQLITLVFAVLSNLRNGVSAAISIGVCLALPLSILLLRTKFLKNFFLSNSIYVRWRVGNRDLAKKIYWKDIMTIETKLLDIKFDLTNSKTKILNTTYLTNSEANSILALLKQCCAEKNIPFIQH